MADLESIARELAAQLKSEFPSGANVQTFVAGGDHVLRVAWPAGDDTARPNKPARGIRLHVSEEVLEDFFGNPEQRVRAQTILVEYVRNAMRNFDATNATGPAEEPPYDDWRVTSELFRR